MDDAEFLNALEKATFPKEQMDHRAHLRLAVLAPERAAGIIRNYAAAIGATGKYNETITQFWMRAVRHHGGRIEELLDSTLPLRHWSKELLWSEAARAQWVDPDLRPLPF
jgi:hypothetical protein